MGNAGILPLGQLRIQLLPFSFLLQSDPETVDESENVLINNHKIPICGTLAWKWLKTPVLQRHIHQYFFLSDLVAGHWRQCTLWMGSIQWSKSVCAFGVCGQILGILVSSNNIQEWNINAEEGQFNKRWAREYIFVLQEDTNSMCSVSWHSIGDEGVLYMLAFWHQTHKC